MKNSPEKNLRFGYNFSPLRYIIKYRKHKYLFSILETIFDILVDKLAFRITVITSGFGPENKRSIRLKPTHYIGSWHKWLAHIADTDEVLSSSLRDPTKSISYVLYM